MIIYLISDYVYGKRVYGTNFQIWKPLRGSSRSGIAKIKFCRDYFGVYIFLQLVSFTKSEAINAITTAATINENALE